MDSQRTLAKPNHDAPLLTIAVQVYQPRAGSSNWVRSDRKGETIFDMSRIGAPSCKYQCYES